MPQTLRYRDKIGFADQRRTAPGVFQEMIIERVYGGEIVKYSSHYESSATVNGVPKLRNQISVIGDPYILDNHAFIRYAWFHGVRHEVTSIEITDRRVILDLGDVYQDPEEEMAMPYSEEGCYE